METYMLTCKEHLPIWRIDTSFCVVMRIATEQRANLANIFLKQISIDYHSCPLLKVINFDEHKSEQKREGLTDIFASHCLSAWVSLALNGEDSLCCLCQCNGHWFEWHCTVWLLLLQSLSIARCLGTIVFRANVVEWKRASTNGQQSVKRKKYLVRNYHIVSLPARTTADCLSVGQLACLLRGQLEDICLSVYVCWPEVQKRLMIL